jgi:hypothetical protein
VSMQSGMCELWCEYFRYNDNRREKLILMKPIAEISRGIDLILYNNQAEILGLEKID